MQGKIALEEHWAVQETLEGNRGMPANNDWMRDVQRRMLDVMELRLPLMDEHGIELTILSLNAPAIQAIPDVAEAVELARRANDDMAEQIQGRLDRFRGFAALPMQDPEAASEELTRCVNDLGFKGSLVNGFSQRDVADSAIYYDIPEFRPFWARVEELGMPFYLHPRLQIQTRAQLYEGHPWLYAPAWDFAAQTSVHALRLICSGLFDEFPNIKLVLGHLGERIPFDLWRLDNMMKKQDRRYAAKRPIGDYFRENFHLTTSGQFGEPAFHCSLAEMGVDHIMFSIDYPFEEMAPGAAWFDTTELSDADRLRIGRTNAIELFKLDLD